MHDSAASPIPRRVVVTGASGLLGGALVRFLESSGAEVVPLARAGTDRPRWDPEAGTIDAGALEGFDAVVHLAGASIAGRFTARHRARVMESRRRGTRLLAETLARLERPPATLLSASGVGYYGDRGEEALDESSGPGSGYLAEVAQVWERETGPAEAAGVRVVRLRMGLVLTPRGGALAPMLLPARLGLGGPLGNGRQWWSWIALDDLLSLMAHVLVRREPCGAVNAVAPAPVRQADFARALGRVLRRPAVIKAPAFALRTLLGRGMADALLLASARVRPARALAGGFTFRFPEIEPALRHVLGGAAGHPRERRRREPGPAAGS
jgi:uncharacterized protein (TIGR01777 family)